MLTARWSMPNLAPASAGGPTHRAKTAASSLGQAAAEKIDAQRSVAASGLDSAASVSRENADGLPGGESVKRAAHASAEALSSTADYVREDDLKSMLADAQKIVKNNPGPALLTAAILGFLVARTLSRD